jgi:BA14K-like protein
MTSYMRLTAIAALIAAPVAALMGGLLTGTSASALPLTAGAKEIAASVESQALTTQVQARRGVRAAPRVIRRPAFRAPRIYRPFVRRRAPVIIGISPFFYGPYPYDYDPYYYYGAPYDGDGAVAYCIRRFKSYDLRSRTYLGYDGFRHPCP